MAVLLFSYLHFCPLLFILLLHNILISFFFSFFSSHPPLLRSSSLSSPCHCNLSVSSSSFYRYIFRLLTHHNSFSSSLYFSSSYSSSLSFSFSSPLSLSFSFFFACFFPSFSSDVIIVVVICHNNCHQKR